MSSVAVSVTKFIWAVNATIALVMVMTTAV